MIRMLCRKIKSKDRILNGSVFGKKFSSSNGVPVGSLCYVDDLYQRWLKDENSVEESWRELFAVVSSTQGQSGFLNLFSSGDRDKDAGSSTFLFSAKKMAEKFRRHGHYVSNLDPLGISSLKEKGHLYSEDDFSLESFGFSSGDKLRDISGLRVTNPSMVCSDVASLHSHLQQTYCGPIGFEFSHLEDKTEYEWLENQIESKDFLNFTNTEKALILDRLCWSCNFEVIFVLSFGLEGCESMIPGLKTIIDTVTNLGAASIVIGMPHRGRLNVLANVLRKPLERIFAEFHGVELGSRLGSGDVKYHLGCSSDRVTAAGKEVHITLVPNPSHLEAVNPVVLGKTKAKQIYSKDMEMAQNIPFSNIC